MEGDGECEVGPNEEMPATKKLTTVEVGRAVRLDWDDEDEVVGWLRDAHEERAQAQLGLASPLFSLLLEARPHF